MNGVHDIGGMDGFGAVERETGEPVFHEAWEGRVFVMFLISAGLPPATGFDAARHRLERLSPAKYLSSSYYERWLAAMERALIDAGTLKPEEIDARVRQFAEDSDFRMPRREDPARAERLVNVFRAGKPVTRHTRQRPRFALGDKIVTRNLNPHGHTRLPRYARGKHGVIVAHRGAHVFPDTNAHGLGENPQHLYTVRIGARELWGDDAESNGTVLIDLWESYVEKDKSAFKSKVPKIVPKTAVAAKKMTAKAPERRHKVPVPAALPRRSPNSPPPSAMIAKPVTIEKNKRGRATESRERSGRNGRAAAKPMRTRP